MVAPLDDAYELVVVVDIDGVVADNRHRLPLIRSGDDHHTPQWGRYFDLAPYDPSYPLGVTTVMGLAAHLPIVWVTGRPERCRTATIRWLDDHGLPSSRLVMRPDHDTTANATLKAAQVDYLRTDRHALPVVVLDDSAAVVRLLTERHVPAVLVTWHGEHVESWRG